jgi:hypothetical protein
VLAAGQEDEEIRNSGILILNEQDVKEKPSLKKAVNRFVILTLGNNRQTINYIRRLTTKATAKKLPTIFTTLNSQNRRLIITRITNHLASFNRK